MTKIDPMALTALREAIEKAEPKLAAALARHGVTSPDQLPPEVARKVFQEAMTQTAAEHFPGAQIDALQHGLAAFQHPRFSAAFTRIRSKLETPGDAFAMASGIDAAIVLAGFGLPVAPFDRNRLRIVAEPSNDIDTVAANFATWKTAFVGYSPCDIPFYMLLTDCVQTAGPQIAARPELKEANMLLQRTGAKMTEGPTRSFQHGIVLIPREPGDSVSTAHFQNPSPTQGSIALYAGWSVNGTRMGAPNDGFLPVPLQFLSGACENPEMALWVWKPVGFRAMTN